MSVEGELTRQTAIYVEKYQVAQLIYNILLSARSETETQSLSTLEILDRLRFLLPDSFTNEAILKLISFALMDLYLEGLAELTTDRRHLALGLEDQLVR